jgi:hypothetical protein
MSTEQIREAIDQLLDKDSAKCLETLSTVLEARTLEALQDHMQVVGQQMFSEGVSKKHFKMVAAELAKVTDPKDKENLAKHHAAMFKQMNPRFDHKKFYHAAGVGHLSEGVDEADHSGLSTQDKIYGKGRTTFHEPDDGITKSALNGKYMTYSNKTKTHTYHDSRDAARLHLNRERDVETHGKDGGTTGAPLHGSLR